MLQTMLKETIIRDLRKAIVSGKYKPHEHLKEISLCKRFQVSRTPIREALKRLALESLVSIVPRRGMFVTNIGINDLQRLLEVRLGLETLAVRLAAQRGTLEHWKRMEHLIVEPSAIEDGNNLIHLDETFHEIIYEAADNLFLHDAITVLLTLNERLWYYFLPEMGGFERTLDDHRLIWESLKSGDGDQAAIYMERHILSSQEKLQSVILGKSP